MARKPVDSIITQAYGVKSSKYKEGYHPGVDLRASTGTPIVAPENGLVTVSAYGPTGGHQVLIQGDSGTLHKLFHNSKRLVSRGQRVSEGQTVALAGNTGFSEAPHCHWGTFRGTQDYNPMSWLAAQNAPKPTPSQPGMPKIGSTVRITINRTSFKPGTATPAGILRPAGGSNYIVRGYDPKFNKRIIVNSASAGGTVAVALYYVSGQRIEGWG